MQKTVLPFALPRPIEYHIHILRGRRIMLDSDLAKLYGVETRRLNEAVKRNASRFPKAFMFRLTAKEGVSVRSQIATASRRNIRHQPLAFTEHGVVMLSAVLNSARAVHMSIVVVNAFVRMRELVAANKLFGARIRKLEQGHGRAVSVIEILAGDIDRLSAEVKEIKAWPPPPKRKIGFTR